jgi:hypothetical protein
MKRLLLVVCVLVGLLTPAYGGTVVGSDTLIWLDNIWLGNWLAGAPGGSQAVVPIGTGHIDYSTALWAFPVTQVTDLGGGYERISHTGSGIQFSYGPSRDPFVEFDDLVVDTLAHVVTGTLVTNGGILGTDVPLLDFGPRSMYLIWAGLSVRELDLTPQSADAFRNAFPGVSNPDGATAAWLATPEPSTCVFLGTGLLTLLALRRRT